MKKFFQAAPKLYGQYPQHIQNAVAGTPGVNITPGFHFLNLPTSNTTNADALNFGNIPPTTAPPLKFGVVNENADKASNSPTYSIERNAFINSNSSTPKANKDHGLSFINVSKERTL